MKSLTDDVPKSTNLFLKAKLSFIIIMIVMYIEIESISKVPSCNILTVKRFNHSLVD